jgi:hypothetical protein
MPPTRRHGLGERESEQAQSSECITLPPLHDIVCRQVGTVANEHQLKHPWTGTGPPAESPGRLHLTQVTSDHEERDEHSVRVNGTNPSFRDLEGPSNLGRSHDHLCRGIGASSLSFRGVGSSFKKPHTKNCLLSSTQYAYMRGKPYAFCMTCRS